MAATSIWCLLLLLPGLLLGTHFSRQGACLLLTADCALPPALPCAQGEEAKAEGNVSGVTDTALVELREGLFAVLASGQVPIAIIAPPAAQ